MMRALFFALAWTISVSTATSSFAQNNNPIKPAELENKLPSGEGVQSNTEVEDLQTIPADTTRVILKQFKENNPDAREHKLSLVSEAYTEDASNPAIKLERMWVGSKGTLLEIIGLPRRGQSNSAVISNDTIRLVNLKSNLASKPLGIDGVSIVSDRRGGVALILKPGDTMYILMEPIDDLQPMRLNYKGWDGRETNYFDRIDPRFRERYDGAFKNAMNSGATPDALKDYLIEFGRNDPDKKAPVVFMALINRMRAQNTFEGFYQAYLLIKDPADAKAAFRLIKNDEHRFKVEAIAVASLADKNRLLDVSFQLNPSTLNNNTFNCGVNCTSNTNASRNITGTISVKAKQGNSPIKLRVGTYQVTFNTELILPRWGKQESNIGGSFDKQSDDITKGTVSVVLSPPNYSATVPVDFGSVLVASAQRSSSGSYSRFWAIGDARATIKYKNMELVK